MITDLIGIVDQLILGYVQAAFFSLSPSVEAVWKIMFIVFIALYGYKVIMSGNFSLNDLIVHSIKIIVILILATQWGTFTIFVYDTATDLPNQVAGAILSSTAPSAVGIDATTDTSSANALLNDFFIRGGNAAKNITAGAEFYEVGLYLYWLIVWVVTILVTGFAAFLIILAKLAVAILLAIAPVFILLLIFANTRSLFEGWFRALVNYALIPLFVYTLLALILVLMEKPLQALEANSSSTSEIVSYISVYTVMGLISFVLLTQVTNLAAGIAGGFALSTLRAFGAGLSRISRATGRPLRSRPARDVKELAYQKASRPLQQALNKTRFDTGDPNRHRRIAPPEPATPATPSPRSAPSSGTPGTPSGAAPGGSRTS